MPRAILTDLDGVVRRWPAERLDDLETRTGISAAALRSVAFDGALLGRAVTGRITDEAWRDEVATTLAGKFPDADASEAVRIWSDFPGLVDREVLGVLDEMRTVAGDVRVALLTNATTRLARDLETLGLASAFEAVFDSSAIGAAKPDPAIFHHALDQLDIAPERVVFIDDASKNVEAARAIGMTAITFTGSDPLRESLMGWASRER